MAPSLHYENATISFVDAHLRITLKNWQYDKNNITVKGDTMLAQIDPIDLGHHMPWFKLETLELNKLALFLPAKDLSAQKLKSSIAKENVILDKLSFADHITIDHIAIFSPDHHLLYTGLVHFNQGEKARQIQVLLDNAQSKKQSLNLLAKSYKRDGRWQGEITPVIHLGLKDQFLLSYLEPYGLNRLKSFKLNGRLSLQNHKLKDIALDYQLQGLEFSFHQHKRHYEMLQQRIIGQKEGGNWDLSGINSQVEGLEATKWFALKSQNNRLTLDIHSFDLLYFKFLTKYLPKAITHKYKLAALTDKLSGHIQNFSLAMAQKPMLLQSLSMDILKLDYAYGTGQYLSLCDARVLADDHSASISIQNGFDSTHGADSVHIPLKGTLKAFKSSGSWRLQGDTLQMQGTHFKMPLDLSITNLFHAPTLVFKAQGQLLHVENLVSKLVPFFNKDSAMGYASESIVSWPVAQLNAQYKGPLNLSDFYKGLVLSINGKDLRYRPSKNYGSFAKLQAQIDYKQNTLNIRAKNDDLNLNTLMIKNLQASLTDLNQDHTHIWLEADLYSKNIDAATLYIRQSPLKSETGSLFDWLEFSGPFNGHIQLDAPLSQWQQGKSYKSTIWFKNNTMRLAPYPKAKLMDMQGVLHINGEDISMPALKGSLAGRPFVLSIYTDNDAPFTHHVSAESYFNSAWLNSPSTASIFQGIAPFSATMSINDQKKTLSIKSNLKPVAIKAPVPLSKVSGQSRSLSISGDFSQKDRFMFDLKYNNMLDSKWDLGTSLDDGIEINRAALYYRQSIPATLPQSGLKIRASIDNLIPSDWYDLFKGAPGSSSGNFLNPPFPLDAQIQTTKLSIAGQHFQDAKLGLRYKDNMGRLSINSSDTNGSISWLHNANKKVQITAGFKDLHLSKNKSAGISGWSYSALLPYFESLHFNIDKLYFNGQFLGEFSGQGVQEDKVLHFAPLTLSNSHYDLEAYLDSNFQTKPSASSVKMRINFDQGDPLFQALFDESFIKDVNGQFNANLRWKGDIKDFKNNHLSGKAMLVLQDGDLMFIQSKWLNFLGMVNLSNLFKNKDAGNGLPFDHFGAEYILDDAVARINKLDLIGSVANLKGQGFVDFKNKHIDQQLLVMPHVSKGASVAAGLLGGPIAGAATYVGGLILRNTVLKDKGILYRIYGDLQNPKVHRVE